MNLNLKIGYLSEVLLAQVFPYPYFDTKELLEKQQRAKGFGVCSKGMLKHIS